MRIIKLPNLIDPHVHLRTPGQEHKEDFTSGTKAALAGGFTTVLDMPNNKVPITTLTLLEEKRELAKEQSVCDLGFYFGSLGDNFGEFAKITGKVHGLKLFLNETTGNFLISKEMLEEIYQSWPAENGPILNHAEDDAVAAVIETVRKTGKRAHFCHISLQSDLEQIIKAKVDNLPITCGVTPHHLFLTEDDAKTLGPWGKMKPYLKSKTDVSFLWEHLKDIDVIESDHAPHTKEEKEGEPVPFGVPGLETTIPLLLTAVSENNLTIDEIIRLCSTNPARIFGITSTDSYAEVDLDESYEISNETLFTKAQWSPFNGFTAKGRVVKTVLHGKTVFEKGNILTTAGSGKVI